MSIGFNVHGQGEGVANPSRLLNWVQDNKPNWMLVMDNLQMAVDMKHRSLATNVIHRDYTPDGAWFNHTPREYLNWLGNRLKGIDVPIWGYVDNEAGANPKWYSELIKLNKDYYNLNIVFGNWSVGTPAQPWELVEPDMREMITLAGQNRNNIVLGIHEYGHVTLLSGYQGQHYWLEPTLAPDKVDKAKPNYHVGRYKFLQDYYPDTQIRIVVTEHGWDTLGDMKWWIDKSGGIFSAMVAWNGLYGTRNKIQIALEQLKYADNTIYKYGSKVEGQLLYCYGHLGDRWKDYDFERLGDEFLAGLTVINKRSVSVPPIDTKPPTPPEPPVNPPPVVTDRGDLILKDLQLIIDKYKAK